MFARPSRKWCIHSLGSNVHPHQPLYTLLRRVVSIIIHWMQTWTAQQHAKCLFSTRVAMNYELHPGKCAQYLFPVRPTRLAQRSPSAPTYRLLTQYWPACSARCRPSNGWCAAPMFGQRLLTRTAPQEHSLRWVPKTAPNDIRKHTRQTRRTPAWRNVWCLHRTTNLWQKHTIEHIYTFTRSICEC